MYSHKPPSLKPHNKAKNTIKNHFQKSALKPPSIKASLTINIHRLNHLINMLKSNYKITQKYRLKTIFKKVRSNSLLYNRY